MRWEVGGVQKPIGVNSGVISCLKEGERSDTLLIFCLPPDITISLVRFMFERLYECFESVGVDGFF